ncbi:MAG TPA: hypothetical protein VJ548_06020 [Azospira sp.]|jgi:hypothetical protein|nr:hypothetical protein [Azospira sp.]
MGSLSNESFEEFLDSLKQAGITITNESELRERLAEAQSWRYAFMTLATNGRAIGIRFEDKSAGNNGDVIRQAFDQYAFPEKYEAAFESTLRTHH